MPGLDGFIVEHGALAAVGAFAALALGGFAKGVVGFALPLIAISLLASFLPAQTAIALLILPILCSNAVQSLRDGPRAAWLTLRAYWRLNVVLAATIAVTAQVVVELPDRTVYGVLGAAICASAALQVAGWRPAFSPRRRSAVEIATGLAGGALGGFAGIWGPPVVLYLLAARTPRVEMVRAQSIVFLVGALTLLVAHSASGLFDATTAPMSAWLVAPTILAMLLGYTVQDRLDQERFRRATLLVLLLAGLNLLRRAIL